MAAACIRQKSSDGPQGHAQDWQMSVSVSQRAAEKRGSRGDGGAECTVSHAITYRTALCTPLWRPLREKIDLYGRLTECYDRASDSVRRLPH